nr:S26 family signal peptidase [Methanothermococcus okinawensis]
MNINNKRFNKKDIIEWAVFLIVLLTVWSHVNVVVSNSMYPIMERGDFVIVENANWEFNPNNVQVGDIVVYKAHWPKYKENYMDYMVKINNKTLIVFSGNKVEPVIHRVIEKVKINNSNYIITKGDNNPTYDPELISTNQIKQRVVTINGKPLVIPHVGYISILLKEYVWLVILLIVLWYVYDYLKKGKKEKEDLSKK